MKTADVKGYIVIMDGTATRWSEENQTLYRAYSRSPATVFRSRGIAKRRIQKTLEFAEYHKFGWGRWPFSVVMVRGEARLDD